MRAKKAAMIADNALIEARKQQEAARYHSQQALLYEAACNRALRHGEKAKGRSFPDGKITTVLSNEKDELWKINEATKSDDMPPPMKINEYPIPPDAMFASEKLPSPPGWESPGAAEAPMHGPTPTNTFKIHAEVPEEDAIHWLLAVIGPPPLHS